MLDHTDSDRLIVEQQLGRPLRGQWAVAKRCHLGVPMVIENHPRLEDGAPFPTLYYLTCPILVKSVSRLEAAGRMAVLNDELADDASRKQRIADATQRLVERRDSHEVIEDSGAPPGGGPDKIKCLHAHTAHELALPPNPVGAIALAEAGWPDCRVPCFGDVG